jgi:hypothetical protein
MADKRISELTLHTTPELSDILPIVNNDETKRVTYGTIYYGIRDGLITENNTSSFATTGSNNFVGNQTITGSLLISGSSAFTNIGPTILSGSLIVTTSTNLTGSVVINELTYPTPTFGDGQYGVEIPTLGVDNIFTMEIPKTVYEYVKNDSGTTLLKGTPVHSIGTVGFNTLVIAASASVASTMPATYILAQDLDGEEEGLGIAIGAIQGINTIGLTAGDAVYVGANGGFTQTKPTGSNLIQNLGIVTKVGTNGGGVVLGAGRSNDVPNIQQGYIWVGNSDSVATPIPTSSFATTGSNVFNDNQTISGSITATSFIGNGANLSNVTTQVTGSWTLPIGASTQSIEVVPGGSYSMWVSGNIPNGIISWNATVTTSNTNVPAIGSQFGWYYVDGNALVLTSIPDQIAGTNGSIISSPSSYTPNTSNVFKFGITNNSGATQTIYWGYNIL